MKGHTLTPRSAHAHGEAAPKPRRRLQAAALGSGTLLAAVVMGGANGFLSASAHNVVSTTPQPKQGPVGTALRDSAKLQGTTTDRVVEFDLWSPGTCGVSGAKPVFTESDHPTAAQGNGSEALVTTGSFTAVEVGTYHWTAKILHGSAVESGPTACADEPVVITASAVEIATTPSAGGAVGTKISDTAHVSGGVHPTGTVTFRLFAPGDTTCATPVATSTGALDNGNASSAEATTTTAGTYNWTAAYGGDSANQPATSDCGKEPVVITASSGVSGLTTTPTPPIPPPTGGQGAAAALVTTPQTGGDLQLQLGLALLLIGSGLALASIVEVMPRRRRA